MLIFSFLLWLKKIIWNKQIKYPLCSFTITGTHISLPFFFFLVPFFPISLPLSPFFLSPFPLFFLPFSPEIQLAFKMLPPFATNNLLSNCHYARGHWDHWPGRFLLHQRSCCWPLLWLQHRSFFEDQLIPFFYFYCHPTG